jgi:hypothetical protein
MRVLDHGAGRIETFDEGAKIAAVDHAGNPRKIERIGSDGAFRIDESDRSKEAGINADDDH